MQKTFLSLLLIAATCSVQSVCAQKASMVVEDLEWSSDSKAGFAELQLPSSGSLLQGFMYKANHAKPHPTLLVLHGYPGNERNLDLAQAVRAHGWNVIYFNYRGSWASQGEFSFRHCVEDVQNVVTYLKQNAKKYEIDTNNICLFGHSMGGFVCLKALQEIPGIKKGFAVSAWDIFRNVTEATKAGTLINQEKEADNYFVLNKKSGKALFAAVAQEASYHNLNNAAKALSNKQVVMIDEHHNNEALANTLKSANHNYFVYEVWNTDHPFTNKRVSLIKKVIAFLDR